MRKRLFSMALCVLFALTLALPARAQEEEEFEREITISTRKDFLRFAEKCRLDSYSQGLKVSLKADLDLEGAEFEGIPIFCGSRGAHRSRMRPHSASSLFLRMKKKSLVTHFKSGICP